MHPATILRKEVRQGCSRVRARLSFAGVISSIAVFVALCGTGFAAGILPADSVGSGELKPDAVTSSRIKDGALKAKDIARGQLIRGARGQAGARGLMGPAGVVDTSHLSTKQQADVRFLRGGLVSVVAQSPPIANNGGIQTVTLACPAGYEAISGGLDEENLGGHALRITESAPLVEGTSIFLLANGQHGAPTGWSATVKNPGLTMLSFTLAVDCAPLG
jgi:hypothetical protein